MRNEETTPRNLWFLGDPGMRNFGKNPLNADFGFYLKRDDKDIVPYNIPTAVR